MQRLRKNQPVFQVAEGEFAGRIFRHGVDYQEVPAAEAHRFERPAAEAPKKRTAKPAQEEVPES